jgi:hypothetical protein
MNKTLISQLKRYIFADSFKKGKFWNGYNVYVPVFKNEYTGGFPFVVLEKDGEFRRCTQKESLEYLNFEKK